ncbi:MAG TPA: alpha/beta hydrolase [Patescibacteria group bacterium]|nr:alpha/beta hydrolase [Patescibacteria group bacterium]
MAKNLVSLPLEGITLKGNLVVPPKARGIVVFSHGGGSGRFSPRNNFVAGTLNRIETATLLLDLLTEEEDLIYENRFNINLLTQRLMSAVDWVQREPALANLAIGFFGASTGAASALRAAATLGSEEIAAVVSRGGRADLAWKVLDQVLSPTLLIVGGEDVGVVELNQEAYEKIPAKKKLAIIPGATHLFEEPGALEEVSRLAREWFEKYLTQT